MPADQEQLITRLLEADCYPHPVSTVEQIETHISRVFLAGDYAYKLKKPVNLGFLDFSTLEKRHHYCREELRLNRRFSPELYLDLESIGGKSGAFKIGGHPAKDFLVKMLRFPGEAELDNLLARKGLSQIQLEKFAIYLARCHQQVPHPAPRSDFGSLKSIMEPALENFDQLAPLIWDSHQRSLLEHLHDWTIQSGERLSSEFSHRKRDGFIRECHGDLHLSNMLWWRNRPMLFDCIEFSENLRWIDPINDIAFLCMDLDDHQQPALGWAFLNRYLQESGDYPGGALLGFYKIYRAMVRAKVAAMKDQQHPEVSLVSEVLSYLKLAESYTQQPRPRLLITHGLSGSGKTSFVRELAPLIGALILQSDRERKRLAGLGSKDASDSAPQNGIYTAEWTEKTYGRLNHLARLLLSAGYSVIVDATFLQAGQRQRMGTIGQSLNVPFAILDFPLSHSELRQRIRKRQQQPDQLSEATEQVLDLQINQQEPLSEGEKEDSIRIDPDTNVKEILNSLPK